MNKLNKLYEVGGCVRDELLGLKSDDIDFTFVCGKSTTVDEGWNEMLDWLKTEGFKIFLETKDCFTVRAKFSKGHVREGLVADFVMARKEVGYYEGTRKPILELGDLDDDLIRRDFTANAIAKDMDGNLVDPLGGMSDIEAKVLKAPTDPKVTMLDDPLRILRAFRFSLTKGMKIDEGIIEACKMGPILDKLASTVSHERIRVEVTKMMKFDSVKTMKMLVDADRDLIPGLLDLTFKNGMWLEPTTKKAK